MKKEIRSLKIASVVHRAISRVLIEDKIFNKIIAVSRVKLSKDFKKADVYIVLSSLNIQVTDYSDSKKNKWISELITGDPSQDDYDINTIVNEMNQYAWSIRKSILCYIDLRFIPELFFKPDLAFDDFVNVRKILYNYT